MKNIFGVALFVLGIANTAWAQLCQGSLGDPVVNITFGSGPNPGPKLAAATTNYAFISFDCPNDGFYTVINKTAACFANSWHTLNADHTGNANGYFMLVNASIQPNDFYVDTIHGLCTNTTFEFAAWIANVLLPGACNSAGIQPNITFGIETTTGTVIQTFNSGDIPSTATPTWKQYGFFFKTPVGVSDFVIRMRNNAPGGCGNDLALDDITFRPCGPKVTAAIAGSSSSVMNLCDGDTASVTFTGSTSTGYTSPAYQWQLSTNNGAAWNDIPGATSANYKRTASVVGSYQYRLAVAEAGNLGISTCRVVSNAITVIVNNKPTASAGNDGPKCPGTAVNLSSGGGVLYSWAGPNNFTSAIQNPVINPVAVAAAGKYYVTVTSSVGCTQKDSTILALFPKPLAQFASSTPACDGGNIQFTDQSTITAQTIKQWYWNFTDGATSVLQNPAHTFSPAATYPVRLVVQSGDGCNSDTLIKQVTIHDLPQPAFILPKVCLADPFAQFIDSSFIADNSSAQFTYAWNFGDPSANAGNPNTSTQKNPQHSYSAIGVYNVALTVTSKDGCINNILKPFTVNGSLPKSQFAINGAGNLCSNQQVSITNNSTVNFGSITKIEVYWDFQNDPTQKTVDDNPVPGAQYVFQYPNFGSPLTKTFQIRYVAYSGINCVNESSQNITLNASPQVQFNALNAVCEEVPQFLITQGKELTGIAGSGVYSGDGTSAGGTFSPRLAAPGSHTIRYTFTAANGCSTFADQDIIVYPQPSVSAGPDKTLLEGGLITLDGSGSGNNISYAWSPNISINNTVIPVPEVSPIDDITYKLTVTSADNCMNSDMVFIKVLKTPVIPNAFSPNGDGINDTWIIQYLNSYPGVDVSLFNRYGQLAFHSIGYSSPWDGTYKGNPIPVGTYYYIIDRKVAGAKKLAGWVMILR